MVERSADREAFPGFSTLSPTPGAPCPSPARGRGELTVGRLNTSPAVEAAGGPFSPLPRAGEGSGEREAERARCPEPQSQDHWIFLHGWGSDSNLWRPLCEHLPGTHHFIDLPGFGSAGRDAADLDTFLDQAAARLPDNAILVGWSLGGMIAAQLAWRFPGKVRALVTLAANAVFSARPDWPQAMDHATFSDFRADFAREPEPTWGRFCALQSLGDRNRKQVLKVLKDQPPPTGATHMAWCRGLDWLAQLDNREALARLQAPQLHLFGAGDGLVPAACARMLAALLPADGRVELLEGLGHALQVSDPAAVAAAVQLWLYPPIDKSLIAESFGRAAAQYDAYAHVQRQVARDLVDFCPQLPADVPVLDLGCGTGFVAELLQQRGSRNLLMADLALPMASLAREKLRLPALVADAENLPLADSSLDALVSSLTLQWCRDLARVAREAMRVLHPGGQLVFSTLGPATLWELKQAWQVLDHYTHVNHFKSPAEIRGELEAGGLRVRALQSYTHRVHYAELLPLLQELKAIGAHNMNAGRKPGLTGIAQLRALERSYRALADTSGLPATYDVILVRAEKPGS